MRSKEQNEQIEIIDEFIIETRDMIEQLEPAIIELDQNIKKVDCWDVLKCGNGSCPRYEKNVDLPCWMHTGYYNAALQTCLASDSMQDCINCQVFSLSNGAPETINAVFRLFHSIKGSAGFLALENITNASHAAENLLDLIRSGGILMHSDHVNLLCGGCDFMKDALDYLEENHNDSGMTKEADAITENLQQAINRAKIYIKDSLKIVFGGGRDTRADDTTPVETRAAIEEFAITPEMIEQFVQEADERLQKFEQDLLRWTQSIDDEEIVSGLFRTVHSLKGDCGFYGYEDLGRISHGIENILEAARSKESFIDMNKTAKVLLELQSVLRDAVADISLQGPGNIQNINLYIELLDDLLPRGWRKAVDEKTTPPPLGDFLISEGVVSENDVDEALKEQSRKLGEILVDRGSATLLQIETALNEQEDTTKKLQKAAEKIAVKKTAPQKIIKRQDIRVSLTKLDSLINLIGELVIAENVVINNPDLKGLHIENFSRAAQQMNKIVRELQEMSMVIRMIPVSGLFRRMIRLVHDLGNKSGKKVELKLLGEETEVDKTVIETIADPLVHLIRNSVDHGLEMPDERADANKPCRGAITLSAKHEEGEIWITVEDDGRGLDKEKILAKAISKGLATGDGSNLSDKQIFAFIFQAGFSTADKITDVSGRGVGMDVVNQNLSKIQGKIELNSKKGAGTKVTLRIPLTLAIIEGMLIRVGDTKCILPILSIREAFRPNSQVISRSPDGLEIVRVREEFFPIVRLHKILNKRADDTNLHDGILIIVEANGKKISLFVDEILGQQQTVIKGLSKYIGNIKGVSGCTILGNGDVSLILDTGGLVELGEHH